MHIPHYFPFFFSYFHFRFPTCNQFQLSENSSLIYSFSFFFLLSSFFISFFFKVFTFFKTFNFSLLLFVPFFYFKPSCGKHPFN
uniref:Putative ovule protein n=1 Tax=Solanum chacoense TaxID=4108 RepID=A0A0V0I1H6_SOLCH